MEALIVSEAEIRSLVDVDLARRWVRDAFVAFAGGKAVLPPAMGFQFPQVDGEMHVKGAYLEGFPSFSVKAASGFYRNHELGLPVIGGMVLVFDARNGSPRAVLLDNGFLTQVRTAAAGALAAEVLARQDARTVAVLGAGGQARFQVEALLRVRDVDQVRVWSRTKERAQECAEELQERFGVAVSAAGSAREAVADADVVVTVTPSTEPIVQADWLEPGVHVTAVGSDFPSKQELAVDVLARADKYVADATGQCAEVGELHHALAAGVMSVAAVHAELGEILSGLRPGREDDSEITVADLTGLGIQDAAMGNLVLEAVGNRDVGIRIPL